MSKETGLGRYGHRKYVQKKQNLVQVGLEPNTPSEVYTKLGFTRGKATGSYLGKIQGIEFWVASPNVEKELEERVFDVAIMLRQYSGSGYSPLRFVVGVRTWSVCFAGDEDAIKEIFYLLEGTTFAGTRNEIEDAESRANAPDAYDSVDRGPGGF